MERANTGAPTAVLEGGFAPFQAVAFSPDGDFLVAGGHDGILRLWNPKTLESLGSFNEHTEAIWSLTFAKNGLLASGSMDPHRQAVAPARGNKATRAAQHAAGRGFSRSAPLAYAPDDAQIAVATSDKNVHLRDAKATLMSSPS